MQQMASAKNFIRQNNKYLHHIIVANGESLNFGICFQSILIQSFTIILIHLFHLYKLRSISIESNRLIIPLAAQVLPPNVEKNKKSWYILDCVCVCIIHRSHYTSRTQTFTMKTACNCYICVKCAVGNKFCETIQWHRISNIQTYSSSPFSAAYYFFCIFFFRYLKNFSSFFRRFSPLHFILANFLILSLIGGYVYFNVFVICL